MLKLDFEYVRNYIKDFDHTLISTEYINSQTKLELKCLNGHLFKICFNSFQQGERCPECYGNKRKTLEDVKKYTESFEYKVLSTEYINCMLKIKFQCPEGHTYMSKYNHFKNGRRCPYCASVKGWSKVEKEIVEYVKTIYFNEVIENDRIQIKNYWSGRNLELDIFLPESSRAIEYNGEYWHDNDKTKWYDEMKRKQCIKKGIDLLVINENDWLNDKICCLNKIDDFIRGI